MIKGFDGKKIETVEAFLDYIASNTGEWCWNDEKLTILAEEILENQRIVERLKQRIDELQEFVDGCEEAKNMPNSMMSPIVGLMEQSELKELKTILGEDNLGKQEGD